MKHFASIVLVMGVVVGAMSALLMPYQQAQSAERLVCWLNIGLGTLMVVGAVAYLLCANRKQEGQITIQAGPTDRPNIGGKKK